MRITQQKDDQRKLTEITEHINSLLRTGADKERVKSQERLDKLQARKRELEQVLDQLTEQAADINGRLNQLKVVFTFSLMKVTWCFCIGSGARGLSVPQIHAASARCGPGQDGNRAL